jgi:hypothetical protein
LTGTCEIYGPVQGNQYNVTNGPDSMTIAGYVSWNQDQKGDFDACGDVFMKGGGGGNILAPFLKQPTPMKCVDHNSDGNMAFSACFSWRGPRADDPRTLGREADLYPANPAKCFCARYDVPTITVAKPASQDRVSPC